MKDEAWVHFHPDERPFLERARDWVRAAEQRHLVRRTDFLDPRQVELLRIAAASSSDVVIHLYGGSDQAERCRALVAPDYMMVGDEDTELTLLIAESADERNGELTHGDYLGALLGLGIKRDKIGDIHVAPGFCQIVVASEISDFIRLHLQQVGKLNVQIREEDISQLQPAVVTTEERSMTVTSLRLDNVLSHLLNISRAKVLAPIRAGHIRVNWRVQEDPSHVLQQGDTLSVRGSGRFELVGLDGVTKKGNYRLRVTKRV